MGMDEDVWPPATASPLADNEAHVWRAWLDQPASELALLWRTLSTEERARAERYRRDRDRARFVVARGLLRTIVARYLDQDPSALTFRYGSHGKPMLGGDAPSTLTFNVSHADGLALFALCQGHDIGVDIERARAIPDEELGRLARLSFSRHELAHFTALPAHLRQDAFFACWTRKEAVVKALGYGLSAPLDRVDVSFAPGEPARVLRIDIDGAGRAATRWTLAALAPAPEYVGALAVPVPGMQAVRRTWALLP